MSEFTFTLPGEAAATADGAADLHAQGVRAFDSGDARTAASLLAKAVAARPDDAALRADLGNALEATGDYEGARAAYGAAAGLAPENPVYRFNLGAACQALGLAHEAAQHYVDAIELEPLLAEAYFNLGMLFFDAGHPDIAVQHYRNALTARPTYAEAAGNLGLTYRRMGDLAQSLEWYRAALGLRPDLPVSHLNLGIVLGECDRHEEAVQAYGQALALDPRYAPARVNMSLSLRALGRPEEAAEEALRALESSPDLTAAHVELGSAAAALQRAGQGQKVNGLLARWRLVAGDHPVLRHAAASLGLEKAPDRADDAYVAQLFDASARRFDEMIRGLGYRVPALVQEALASFVGAPSAALDVLDAGCGTGLAAEALRPYARTLAGIDLSASMLEQAARRRLYDELEQAELTGWLQSRPGAFDLAVLGDVLCYFGDLAPPLAALAGTLRPGGTAILTVEAADPWAPPFTLRESGRYCHRRDYLDQTLRAAGLQAVELRQTTLRHEGGQPVEGILAVARKA